MRSSPPAARLIPRSRCSATSCSSSFIRPLSCPALSPCQRSDMGYADEVFDLSDKVVIVTGGSRGLGKEIAFAVARSGADVVIASRKIENCEDVAKQIERETGRQAMPYGLHVG